MSIVSTKNLGKSFGAVDVFAGLSLSVPHGARIAVVGPNGVGKTTLLRIMAGEDVPSVGSVQRAKGLTIGYLPQESVYQSENTLMEECLLPFEHVREIAEELKRLEAGMAAPPGGTSEEILARYGDLQTRFEHGGGYTYEREVRQVLSGLGFTAEQYDMPLGRLSGGQRTRALLARLLLESPGLLVLDEPTNHLDAGSIEWLEGYIKDWDGAVLVVSHDRYLLDRVCNNTWEMNRGSIETYRGNYSHYLTQRQERWDLRSKEFEAEKERLWKDLEYIKRNIDAQNVAQARGRLKRLSRQLQAIEQIGVEGMRGKSWLKISGEVQIQTSVMSPEEAQRRLAALTNPIIRPRDMKLRLRTRQRGGNIVLRTRGLEVGYPGKPLFKVPDIVLHRQGCAALIGPNGSGKTTFLKTILKKLPPLAGGVELGASLDIGYFAQAHEELVPKNTLIGEIQSVAPEMREAEARSYLARYLFREDDVFKKVSVLSGGERGRLALAKLALGHANLLLLDEPTNHLDIPAQEVLQNVLAEFEGTVILVSHDRYLIDALATQVWEIDPGTALLEVFQGRYSAYRGRQEDEAREAVESGEKKEPPSKREEYRRARAAKNRELARQRRRKSRLAELEEAIAGVEKKLADLTAVLADPPADRMEVARLGDEYKCAQTDLEVLMDEWERLQD
ncbi:MAG: ABC-F family ATP-binding cassette domain-containing protein [bacterium]|jgi:ATP-binding cassette subfamily F protein 3